MLDVEWFPTVMTCEAYAHGSDSVWSERKARLVLGVLHLCALQLPVKL